MQRQLPPACHLRTCNLLGHDFNQLHPLVRGRQRFPLPLRVSHLQQPLDHGRSGRRGSDAASLHLADQLLVLQLFARRFHGEQQAGIRMGRRRLCLVLPDEGLPHRPEVSRLQGRQHGAFLFLLVPFLPGLGRIRQRRHVVPAVFDDHLSVGAEGISLRLGNHLCGVIFAGRVKRGQQPPGHQVVQSGLVRAEL